MITVASKQAKIKEGDRFAKLVAIGPPFSIKGASWIVCQCDCGRVVCTSSICLRTGQAKSCGCFRNPGIAKANKRLARIWGNMKSRCLNPNVPCYKHYGGRGIHVCDEWLKFIPFATWALANGYRDDLEIDRIDNAGDYEPANCRWATRKAQLRNFGKNVMLSAFGETKTMIDWSEDTRCVVAYRHIKDRMRWGWDVREALTTPVLPFGTKRRGIGKAEKP